MNGTLGAARWSSSKRRCVILAGCTGQANPCSADTQEVADAAHTASMAKGLP
jgi:hypothetical protein